MLFMLLKETDRRSTAIVWSKGYYFVFLKESKIFKMQSVLFEEKTV